MADKKTCYIISEIGKPESAERKWANFVREYIIAPAVTGCGYEAPARSDDPDKDLIMADIIQQMFEVDLVIADLSGYNPNVFYELGIRHCAQKPAIHLIKIGQSTPFDLGANKAIFIDESHLAVKQAISDIKERIAAITKEPKQFYSQVQQHIQFKQLELFKTTQTGKDKVLINALMTLVSSIGLQTGMIRDLEQELVVKPKQLKARYPIPTLSALERIALEQYPNLYKAAVMEQLEADNVAIPSSEDKK